MVLFDFRINLAGDVEDVCPPVVYGDSLGDRNLGVLVRDRCVRPKTRPAITDIGKSWLLIRTESDLPAAFKSIMEEVRWTSLC